MAQQLYDGKLLISTVPGNSTSFDTGGAYGVVYALDARTGRLVWSFSTVKGGAILWRTRALAGVNSFPALTRTMIVVGAGARTSLTKAPKGRIVAYALRGTR